MTNYYDNELYHFGVKGMKWGVRRKNYYGESKDKFRASNGVTVGAPKNAGVAAFRKFQATRAGSATLNGMATATRALTIGKKNKKIWQKVEKSVKKENQAVRESEQAHKQAVKEQKKAAANTPEAQARKEKLKKAAKVGAAVAGTALAAYGVYKVSKAISNKKQMKAAEAAVKKSLADKSALMNTVNAAKKNTNFSNANRGAWTSGKHSYVYDKASGIEGYVSTEYLNFLRNQRK